jgi:hypothetical protein
VIDLTQIYNGPYATFLMARAGAEVIKIEPPDGEHLWPRGSGSGLLFAMLNANKRSVMLDLKPQVPGVHFSHWPIPPMFWSKISRPMSCSGLASGGTCCTHATSG